MPSATAHACSKCSTEFRRDPDPAARSGRRAVELQPLCLLNSSFSTHISDLREHTKEIYTIRWSPTGPGTKSLELDFALLFPKHHVLLRVLPDLVVLATSLDKDSESLYKRVNINRLINIFKSFLHFQIYICLLLQ
ncbi:hypothetical protein K1719_024177 [Acacia pycnantha]|nr:hypothetical protein K1719_024177 [Acacia pycnantha]